VIRHTVVHGVKLETDRDRIALHVEGSAIFASTKAGPQAFEPETAAAFRAAVAGDPEGCVIDLGAYTGLYSIMADRAGAAEVVAVEPNEAAFRRLVRNLLLNGALRVCPVLAAAGARTGESTLRIGDERLGICSTGKLDGIAGAGRPVHVLTVDAMEERSPRRVSVIKIDVEGHELAALQGARATLERDRPVLFVEVESASGGDRTAPVLDYLRTLGYRPGPRLDGRNMAFTMGDG
jgi:FkbM family methyltransferase